MITVEKNNQEGATQNPFEFLTRLTLTHSLATRPHVVEPDQINILASTMFRDLQQVQNAKESRLARQFRSNIWKPDRFNRIDFNLAFLHTVSRTYSDAGTHPDSHAASDFSAPYPLAKPFSERHEEKCTSNRAVRLACKTMAHRQMSASGSNIPAVLVLEFAKVSYLE
jgi:hypothetical protein